MGILRNLFSKTPSGGNASDLTKTAEMLDEDLYWSIIAASLERSEDQDDQEEFLIRRVQQLSPKEMIGFRLRTDKLLHDTYTSEMWCAGYIINGGCSDDGFEYFRCWVISRGKDVYYNAKANPDSLISQLDDGDSFEFESFWYVANEAFERITGNDLYDFIDDEAFKFKEGQYPAIEMNWQEEEPESMKAICPKLFEARWNQHMK